MQVAPQVYTFSQVEVDSVVFETDEMMEGDEGHSCAELNIMLNLQIQLSADELETCCS